MRITPPPPPPPPPPHNFKDNDLRIICDELMELKAENRRFKEILGFKIFWSVFWANICFGLVVSFLTAMLSKSSF